MKKLTRNFTLEELCHSDTAVANNLDNTPDEESELNLRYLARRVLQPIRDNFGVPIKINSGYRGPELNAKINGSPTSFHSYGCAADIEFFTDKYNLMDIFEYIYNALPFTELILEDFDKNDANSGWVHVAWLEDDDRHMIKYKLKGQKKVVRVYDVNDIRRLYWS